MCRLLLILAYILQSPESAHSPSFAIRFLLSIGKGPLLLRVADLPSVNAIYHLRDRSHLHEGADHLHNPARDLENAYGDRDLPLLDAITDVPLHPIEKHPVALCGNGVVAHLRTDRPFPTGGIGVRLLHPVRDPLLRFPVAIELNHHR